MKLSIPDAGINGVTVETHGSASPPISITVYPNPARSLINVEFEIQNAEPSTLTLELLNLQGVVVMTTNPETILSDWHKHQMEVSGMAPGVYFLRAKVDSEILIKKVAITR
jgi:hypothetical protein